MENPISYSDLFSPDIQQGIEGLVSDIMRVEKQLKGMLESVKSEAQTLGEALAGVSSATKGGRDTTKADSAQVDKLYEAYTQLSKMYEENQKTLKALLDTEKTQNERLAKAKTATDEYASALDRLKAQAALANEALAKVGTSGNSAEIKQLQAVVKGLEAQVKNLTKAQNANAASAKSMSGANSSQKGELLSLADAYKTLSPLIKQTGVDLDSLALSERAHQQITKNGQVANASLTGSYNQLYAQYNLIKTALNAMSAEMRNSTEVGKVWEAQALRIMNKMKAMQEATGKNTLSVGDYGKALNGLNIATMQVLREMPTLANSLQQFFIAISNNVPIFVDNFKRAQVELGGFTKAIGATLKAVFSWQSVLLVILTILPRVAKAISDKRKAQQEDNKETQKQVNLMNLLREALVAVAKAEVSEVAKLRTLVSITNDHNRSMEERITAATELKNLHEDELKNYSAEEIALGKAKTATDAITKALMEQAKARALLNKITEAYTKQIDAEDERNQLGASRVYEYGFDNGGNIAGFYKYVQNKIKQGFSEEYLKRNIAFVAKGDQDVWERYDKYKQALKDIQTFGATIEALTKRIPVGGLLSGVSDKTTKEKDRIFKELDEIPNFYSDLMQSIVNLTEDELDKELAQFDLDAEKSMAIRTEQFSNLMQLEEDYKTRKAELESGIANESNAIRKAEMQEQLNIVEEGLTNISIEMGYMADIMINEEEENGKARAALVEDIEKRRLDIRRKAVRDEQAEARENRNKLAYEEYEAGLQALKNNEENAKSEAELKDTLNKALLDSERTYWEDYLAQLREEGLLTIEEYNKIMANLVKAEQEPEKKRGRRWRGGVRNLVELGIALNPTMGEKDSETGMLRIKEEYRDFANAVNEALLTSMDYMDEWMDKRIEMAEVAVEAAQKETESAKTALDYEMQARANGYANNVELARKEYEQKLQMEREAIAERKRLEKIQEGINTAQQIGALVTATANLWSGYSKIPFAGPALAIAATALMWSSFFAAKIQAAQLANAETHGQGMAEYIDYGGSHASHNDVDFGRTKDGRRRRVERGEVVGVVRKDKVQKYGIERVMNIINNLNNGTFEKNYVSSTELVNSVMGESPESRANSAFLSAKVEDMLRSAESRSMGLKTGNTGIFDAGQLEANYEMAFNGASTDLSGVEQGIETLIEQNKVRVVSTPWGRIEYKGNNKRIIRNG
jgi:hypothetical protein